MAKTIIEKLREQYRKAADEAQTRAEAVHLQEDNLQKLKQQQEAAALAEDFDKYEALAGQIRKAEGVLYVMQHAKPKAEPVTPEQAAEAWKEYADTWAKDMAQKWRNYKRSVSALRMEYEGLVRFQNDALKIRQEVAELAEQEPEAFTLEGWLPNKYLPNFPATFGALHVPEMAFFGQYEEWPENYNGETGRRFPAEGTLWAIVGRHEPIDNPTF